MKSNHIYNKYKACIQNAKSAFSHYEKYSSCFSIRSVDEEMLGIFRKIGLSYAKLMQMVANREQKTITNNDAALIVTIDECEKLLKEKASFFNNIIGFLDRNESQIMATLSNALYFKKISTDLDALESNLGYANKLVARMELMLRSSQQIYLGNSLGLKSA
jgi:hypothetical protein